MKCMRCLEYPCRCTGGVDVIAEHTARMLAQAQAHKVAIPPSDAVWPEAPRKYERTLSKLGCRETINGAHVVEAGDDVCILCFAKQGKGGLIRYPIPAPPSARTPPVVSTLPKAEEPWSL